MNSPAPIIRKKSLSRTAKKELRNRGLRQHENNFMGIKWKAIEKAKSGEKL
jgi:hypothetical protein